MRTWEEALKEHYEAVIAAGYENKNILGIFAYGSQNYGVETENSDWDTKAIIVPTWEDLVFQPPVSKEIHLVNGEHCEVKDIREIVKMFKKQNINFIEILYTEYKWVNLGFYELWEEYFVKERERIAHYNTGKTVQSICGQAIHTLKQNPTNGKKVANGYRLLRFLEEYLAGVNYKNCIVLSEKEREGIIKLKNSNSHIDSFINLTLAKTLITRLEKLQYNTYEKNLEEMATIDKVMETGILEIIKVILPNPYNFELE